MNVDDIKAQYKEYARSNFFRIRFNKAGTGDSSIKNLTGSFVSQTKQALRDAVAVPDFRMDDAIDVGIKTAAFPSVGMEDANLKWKGFNVPLTTVPALGDLSVSFMVDGEMLVYKYFLKWMQTIVDPTTGFARVTSDLTWDEATIYQIKGDLTLEGGYKVVLQKIYPIDVGEIALGQDEGIAEFEVKFRYMNIVNDVGGDLKSTRTSSLLDRAKSAVGGVFT